MESYLNKILDNFSVIDLISKIQFEFQNENDSLPSNSIIESFTKKVKGELIESIKRLSEDEKIIFFDHILKSYSKEYGGIKKYFAEQIQLDNLYSLFPQYKDKKQFMLSGEEFLKLENKHSLYPCFQLVLTEIHMFVEQLSSNSQTLQTKASNSQHNKTEQINHLKCKKQVKIQGIIEEINNAFFRLEQYMNGAICEYQYFGFNEAFTKLFDQTKKPEDFTYNNCRLIGKYWLLTEQIRIDFDKGNFENIEACENEMFCEDCEEIMCLNWERIDEFIEFSTPDEIAESDHRHSITDLLKDDILNSTKIPLLSNTNGKLDFKQLNSINEGVEKMKEINPVFLDHITNDWIGMAKAKKANYEKNKDQWLKERPECDEKMFIRKELEKIEADLKEPFTVGAYFDRYEGIVMDYRDFLLDREKKTSYNFSQLIIEKSPTDKQSRTKSLLLEKFKTMHNIGWNYAFQSETDFNTFVDLLTSFFEQKEYTLPLEIATKNRITTKLASTIGDIYSELGETLKTDSEFLKLIKILSCFKKKADKDIIKALQR